MVDHAGSGTYMDASGLVLATEVDFFYANN